MKNKNLSPLMFASAIASSLVCAASAFASQEPIEVNALIKCHEGKFDAINAVSQLTRDISGAAVYGLSGIGCYPDQHCEGQSVMVRAPFSVSAPTFVTVGDTPYACVTVQKK